MALSVKAGSRSKARANDQRMAVKVEDPSTPLLDRMDVRILRLLQSDGRLGNAEIAKRVHTSAATCHRRIQRLFAEGYVSSVRALIDPHRVGQGSLVIVGVVLDRSTPGKLRRVRGGDAGDADDPRLSPGRR